MDNLSQEEIELLMSGMLSKEETNKILEKEDTAQKEAQAQTEVKKEETPSTQPSKEDKIFSELSSEAEFVESDDIDKFFENNEAKKEEAQEEKEPKVSLIQKIREKISALFTKKEKSTKVKNDKKKLFKKAEKGKATVKEENANKDVFEDLKESAKEEIEALNKAAKKSKQSEKSSSKAKKGLDIKLKAIIVLTVLVVIMGVLFLTQLKRKHELEMQGKLLVSVPKYNANSPNFIYLSQEKIFKGEKLKLVKMSADSEAVTFYFDRKLDFMLYEAELKDADGRVYNMDLSFISADYEMKSNVVRFESLDTEVSEFTISIIDSNTAQRVDYTIVLKEKLKYIPAKYIPTPVKLVDGNNNVSLLLEDAVFTTNASSLEYRLNWKYDDGYIQLGWEDDSVEDVISIVEKGAPLNPMRDYPAVYSFVNYNTIIGRMDFERVQNLNSEVTVRFDNIYWIKDMANTEIGLENISYNKYGKDVKSQNLTLGRYKLELERFGVFDNYAILVYSAEDLLMPDTEDKINRVEAKIKAELVVTDTNGTEAVVGGSCISKKEGAQLNFNLKDSEEIISKFSNPKYFLRVKYVGLKLAGEEAVLNLSQLDDTTVQTDKGQASDFALEASKKCLAVKALEADKSELSNYFADNVLNDESIKRDYFNTDNIIDKAEYSAQVLCIGKDDSNYYAVVQESWKGNEGIREVHFYRTHKLVIEKKEDKWLVIEDCVVK